VLLLLNILQLIPVLCSCTAQHPAPEGEPATDCIN